MKEKSAAHDLFIQEEENEKITSGLEQPLTPKKTKKLILNWNMSQN